jgi:hypothetical protein
LITIFAEDTEIQPAALATVYVYVLGASPDMVVLDPVPFVVVPPGDLVNVHVPVAGSPFNNTAPVPTKHVG